MEAPIGDTIEDAGRAAVSVLSIVIGVAIGVVAAYVLARVIGVLAVRLARRHPVAAYVTDRCRRPFRFLLTVIGAAVGFVITTRVQAGQEEPTWRALTLHGLVIVLIIAAAWLLTSVVLVAQDAALGRYRLDSDDNRHARRVHTQVQILRRLVVALVWVCALAAVLLTFPGARAVGASVLASAGVASIVAGLAAQSALANVFAGMQLAFTDAIRVDDVVIVEGQFGRIEEITLTYVVVHLWDDRRMIMPSTYFTSTPFENWTRRAADLLGTVEMDLDWRVPVAALRAELAHLLEHTDMWDRRVGGLQLTEATGGYVRARVVLSAPDAGVLFDLRCYVREGLVDWLQREAPFALPRTRYVAESGEGWTPAVDDDSAWESADDDAAEHGPDGRGRSADGAAADGAAAGAAAASDAEAGAPDGAGAPHAAEAGTDRSSKAAVDDPPAAPRGRKGKGRGMRRGKEAPGAPADPAASRPEPADQPAAPEPRGPRRTPVRERANLASIERDARFYTGSIEGIERAKMFRGPSQHVIAEREETAERANRTDGAEPVEPTTVLDADDERG